MLYLKTDTLGHHEIMGDHDMGWSFSSLNPFKVASKIASSTVHLASGAINTVHHLYDKVTPNQLKSVLRWTPQGLVYRAGVSVAPATKAVLSKAVRWSPQGMIYQGVEHKLGTV